MKYLRPNEALLTIKKIYNEDPHLGLACEILYTTGRRISELLNLSMVHCEIDRNYTILVFKALKKRERQDIEVKIPAQEWERWCEIMQSCGAPITRSYFFSRKKRGKEDYRALVSRYVRVLNKIKDIDTIEYLLGQKNNRFHLWRHSYVYQLYNKFDMDIMSIHQAIGHESIDTTIKFYGNWLFPAEKRFAKWWND